MSKSFINKKIYIKIKKIKIILGFISGFLLGIFELIRLGCVLYGIFFGAFTIGFVFWSTPENTFKSILYLFACVGVHTTTKVIGKMYLQKSFEKTLEFYSDKISGGVRPI